MSLIGKISAAMADAAPRRLVLPEHRQIELYSKRKSLEFEEPDEDRVPYPRLAGVVGAFHLLERFSRPAISTASLSRAGPSTPRCRATRAPTSSPRSSTASSES